MQYNKYKFGNPHIIYHESPKKVAQVKKKYFEIIEDNWTDNKKIIGIIHKNYGVKESNIRRWAKRWTVDPDYDPCDVSVHGSFHRIFSNDQENSIVDFIDRNFISVGRHFSDFLFQTIIYSAYDEIYPDFSKAPKFEYSPGFISYFKKKT